LVGFTPDSRHFRSRPARLEGARSSPSKDEVVISVELPASKTGTARGKPIACAIAAFEWRQEQPALSTLRGNANIHWQVLSS
jgi:hypothetical protein